VALAAQRLLEASPLHPLMVGDLLGEPLDGAHRLVEVAADGRLGVGGAGGEPVEAAQHGTRLTHEAVGTPRGGGGLRGIGGAHRDAGASALAWAWSGMGRG
jgi:hypothetical protein